MTTYETTNGPMTEKKTNNHVVYDDDEIDNSSETSKDYASSNSSFVEDVKKRDSLTSVEDNKEEKSKRSKRHSFRMFKRDDKDDKEKSQSEGLVRSLSGMAIFGGSKDKDNKRNHTDGENFLRPNSRTSTNSGKSKNRRSFIFSSDNDDDNNKLDVDLKKGRKSRRSSSSDADKEKKKGNRLSMNLGKLLGLDENKPSHKPNIWDDTFIEPDQTSMSPKSPIKNSYHNGGAPKHRKISNIMNDSDMVESPTETRDFLNHLTTSTGTDDLNKLNSRSVSKSDNDDLQSIHSSSTLPSSVNDQDEILSYQRKVDYSNEKNDSHVSKDDEQSSPTTPMTPKLIVTHSDPKSVQHHKVIESEFNNNNNIQKQVVFEKVQEQQSENVDGTKQSDVIVESKPDVDRMIRINEIKNTMNVKPLVIDNEIDNPIHAKSIIPDEREIKNVNNTTDTVEKQQPPPQQHNIIPTQMVDKDLGEKKQSKKPFSFPSFFQDDKKKSTNNILDEQALKRLQELEEINSSLNSAKADLEAKVIEQNGKLNSIEQIMQQQIDVTNRMTETMQRLELKVNSPKEEHGHAHDSTMLDTIKRLEDKIDHQNEELNYLKSIVGQLTGGPLLLTDGESSQAITYQLRANHNDLVPTSPSQQAFSRPTLVSTLVVNPLYNTISVSASVATSVLYAVYVRPIVGLVKVVRNGM